MQNVIFTSKKLMTETEISARLPLLFVVCSRDMQYQPGDSAGLVKPDKFKIQVRRESDSQGADRDPNSQRSGQNEHDLRVCFWRRRTRDLK
jgi:hypothetical protein